MSSRFLILIVLILFGLSIHAQTINKVELQAKMDLLKASRPTTTLFVHFDKNVYTNNETAWFTGYLVKGSIENISQHKIMSVGLIRDVDTTLVKQEKFLIKDGISFGNMQLPDSLLAGKYHFQVTTDRIFNGLPDVFFTQPILIKTDIQPSFKTSIKLIEQKQDSYKVLVSVLSKEGYLLNRPSKVLYRFGRTSGTRSINNVGEALISINGHDRIDDPNLYAKIISGTDTALLSFPISQFTKKAVINFYPEGGNLVSGVSNKIAWEAKDNNGRVLTLKAILLNNNKPVDTIETNSSGIGQFYLLPNTSPYYVKLLHSQFTDSLYRLPEAKPDELLLNVTVGTPNDSLHVLTYTKNSGEYSLMIHDFTSSYYTKTFRSIGNSTIKIPMTGLPKGLKSVTIFDALGRPIAERMIFCHYGINTKIDISKNKQVYNKRDSVTIKLKLTGKDTVALVSIACVQDNRINPNFTNDIQSYIYLSNLLESLPLAATNRPYDDQEYLENILLTKGWRRYSWKDLKEIAPADTLRRIEQLPTQISVLKSGKPINNPIAIAVFNSSGTKLEETDINGKLNLNTSELIAEYGKNIKIAAIGKRQQALQIKAVDPFTTINKKFAKLFSLQEADLPSLVEDNISTVLKSNESAIRLKEVKITSKRDNSINYLSGNNSKNNNFGGCPYHPYGPGPGEICGFPCYPGFKGLNVYDNSGRSVSPGGGAQLYQQMYGKPFQELMKEDKREFIVTIPSVYLKKEFYQERPNSNEPYFASTIFWRHGAILTRTDSDFHFSTSDIVGKFRIVVQGITDTDLIYADQILEVH